MFTRTYKQERSKPKSHWDSGLDRSSNLASSTNYSNLFGQTFTKRTPKNATQKHKRLENIALWLSAGQRKVSYIQSTDCIFGGGFGLVVDVDVDFVDSVDVQGDVANNTHIGLKQTTSRNLTPQRPPRYIDSV